MQIIIGRFVYLRFFVLFFIFFYAFQPEALDRLRVFRKALEGTIKSAQRGTLFTIRLAEQK